MKKPSVTELLDLLAKPALLDWANRLGLEGISLADRRKRSLAKGSSIHRQIEDYCKGEGDFERDIDRHAFQQFTRDKKIITVEGAVETPWFIGRYDAKIEIEGNPWLVDYKSGHKGKIYLENKLQLIAYGMAECAECGLAVVGVPQFVLLPFVPKDRHLYEKILIALSQIYYLKKEIENDQSGL